MHLQNGLIAAAGHQGRAALWGLRKPPAAQETAAEADEDDLQGQAPLLSWKAHKGWVSTVQFVPGASQTPSGSRLLLTASNDSTVILWDVHKAHTAVAARGKTMATPRSLGTTSNLHRTGVFSLDIHSSNASEGATISHPRVVSAGKDGVTVLSEIRPETGELAIIRRFDEHHAGVVKCVRWCTAAGSQLFADCGNDKAVRDPPSSRPSTAG